MKKILVPILTTAALVPVAVTSVACGATTINLDDELKEEGNYAHVNKNFDITEEKQYKVIFDFSKVPSDVLESKGDEGLGFYSTIKEGESEPCELDEAKVSVIFNGNDLTDSMSCVIEDDVIYFDLIRGFAKTDKLVINVAWKKSYPGAFIALGWIH